LPLNILFLGDVFGQPGRDAVVRELPGLIEEFAADFVIANGENAANGAGITSKLATKLLNAGVDVITTGNHVWRQRRGFCVSSSTRADRHRASGGTSRRAARPGPHRAGFGRRRRGRP